MLNEFGDCALPQNESLAEHPITLSMREWQKAVAKFPTWPTDPFHALAVVGEEIGELNKALLQYVYEPEKGVTLDDIREEAVQSAAMVLRWIASMDRYQFVQGHQHQQPMPPYPIRNEP